MKPPLVVKPLARALHGGDLRVLKQAAWALGSMRSSRARRVLVVALKSSRRIVRYQAAGALWRSAVGGFTNRRVEQVLIGMLKGDKGHVAITLSHMLRNRTITQKRVYRQSHRPQASILERMGGAWIR